mgnify:CR=1 FL=1
MSTEIIKVIENQKILPIIGKGSSLDIIDKFNRLLLEKYKVIIYMRYTRKRKQRGGNIDDLRASMSESLNFIPSIKKTPNTGPIKVPTPPKSPYKTA